MSLPPTKSENSLVDLEYIVERLCEFYSDPRTARAWLYSRHRYFGGRRPVGTSNGNNTVWHGYVPYNLAMMGVYLRFSVSKTSIRRTCGAQSH